MNSIPNEIKADDWLDYAASFPVAFAQVREDALIDQWITNQLPDAAQGIMIASGGCTAALLAATGKFDHLTLVDMNPAQLALAKLKIAFVSDYEAEERLNILGHRHSPRQSDPSISEILQRYQIATNTFGNIEAVATLGLDYIGRYELLFTRLQHVIATSTITEDLLTLGNPTGQQAFLSSHPDYVEQLKEAFVKVMALPNLVRLFGKEATQNSILPFAEHFFARTLHVIETLPANSNPYLAQLLLGRFTETTSYPWLTLPKQSISTGITYQQTSMVEALEKQSEAFDFIHLSNILDWLNEEQATQLLKLASAKLKKSGWLIIRQLNSNLPIQSLCQSLHWKEDIATKLHESDRSFFYQKLHVARGV